MRKKSLSLLFLLPFLGFFQTTASAQATGTITGKVADAARHGIVGVTIHIQPDNGTASVHTDHRGFYVIRGLPAGKYDMTLAKKGFKETTHRATVKAGEATHVDFNLHATKARP